MIPSQPRLHMNILTGLVIWAVFGLGLIALPVAAVRILVQDVNGSRTGRLNDGINAAVLAAWFWAVFTGGWWIFGDGSGAWMLLPALFGWTVGGACVWRLHAGWRRWVHLLALIVVAPLPALLISIAAPGFANLTRRSRGYQALVKAVPEAAAWQASAGRDPAVVEKVAAALSSPDPMVRFGAAEALRSVGASSVPAAPQLAACLADKDEHVRYACAAVFSDLGAEGLPAIRAFLPTAGTDGAQAARAALQYVQVPLAEAEAFAAIARDQTVPAHARAVAVFAVSRSSAAAASLQDEGLHDSSVEVRREAASLRGAALESGFTDPDAEVRRRSFLSLALSTPVPAARLPVLLRGLQDPEGMVRASAAMVMNYSEAWPPQAIAALIQTIDDSNRGASWQAIGALGRAGAASAPAVDRLIRLVREADPQFEGMMAVDALGRIGPAAARAVPAVREWARRNPKQRYFAVDFYVKMGEAGYVAVPDVIEMLETGDDTLRNKCAHALGEMAPAALPAIPALQKARGDKAFGVSYLANQSLKKIFAAHHLAP